MVITIKRKNQTKKFHFICFTAQRETLNEAVRRLVAGLQCCSSSVCHISVVAASAPGAGSYMTIHVRRCHAPKCKLISHVTIFVINGVITTSFEVRFVMMKYLNGPEVSNFTV